MQQMSDIQRLEARIADLENQVRQLRGGGYAPAATSVPGTGIATGEMRKGDWLAGVIAQVMAAQGGGQYGSAPAMAPGAMPAAPGISGQSSCWCESRFVCATMHCGGSSWC